MADNIKVIYTEDGKNRLSELKEMYANIIEETIKQKKYVPGDQYVEVTASDIEYASRYIKIIRNVKNNNRYNVLYSSARVYIAAGIFIIIVQLFRQYSIYKVYILNNIFLSMGVMSILLGVIILGYLKFKEKRFQSNALYFDKDYLEDYRNFYAPSFKYYDRDIATGPKLSRVWLDKGKALTKLGNYEEALSYFDIGIKLNPHLGEAWLDKGNAFAKLGNYYEALSCYDKAIERDPRLGDAWFNKGKVLQELSRFDEAFNAFEKANELGLNENALEKLKS